VDIEAKAYVGLPKRTQFLGVGRGQPHRPRYVSSKHSKYRLSSLRKVPHDAQDERCQPNGPIASRLRGAFKVGGR
jgi:hypothetical protein